MQPLSIISQPKSISKVPFKEKFIFPERSVQYIDQVVQAPKSIVPKIVVEQLKKTLCLDNALTKSKRKNGMQNISREKSTLLIQFTGPTYTN